MYISLTFNYIKKYLEYKLNTDIFKSKLIASKSEGKSIDLESLEDNFVSWIWSKEESKEKSKEKLKILVKAFIYNYNVIKDIPIKDIFKWYHFCLFINIKNIDKINMEINKAIFDIENHAIVKIVFLDFSLKINEILFK